LTTPLMRGDDVKMLQARLQRHGFLKDPADGEYGILTAQAVYRAKFWLGYTKPDQVAAALLMSYLGDTRKPTAAMKGEGGRTEAQAVAQAAPAEGAREPEGAPRREGASGRVEPDRVGVRVVRRDRPVVRDGATRAYVDAGSLSFRRGQRYAYVPFIVHDARAGAEQPHRHEPPEPGDLVCYDWEHNGVADHVGLFEQLGRRRGRRSSRRRGEHRVGNDSNGGEVMRRDRSRALVQAFVHVGR
jgi:hypothetical protein